MTNLKSGEIRSRKFIYRQLGHYSRKICHSTTEKKNEWWSDMALGLVCELNKYLFSFD